MGSGRQRRRRVEEKLKVDRSPRREAKGKVRGDAKEATLAQNGFSKNFFPFNYRDVLVKHENTAHES